ncbi:hypothetical protein [Fodinibius saliphilus]|uniref:hypothetical protein n=1 Tax=Fodinibius saliphilus TaxID=1920650 RepID=UPI00110857B5|nr:hypothetical protein [Fodinibius saliphilus]
MKRPTVGGLVESEKLSIPGKDETATTKISNPSYKGNSLADTARRLAVLYQSTEYGLPTFRIVLESVLAKYERSEQQQIYKQIKEDILWTKRKKNHRSRR